jgi:Holliday junction resolvase
MSDIATEQRIAALEGKVERLTEWMLDKKADAIIASIAQRVTNRLFELGSTKVDMQVIAKLSAALGVDVMPLTKRAPKPKKSTAKTKKA